MKTNKLTKTYMEKRISRYLNLEPLPIQLDETIPQAGKILFMQGNYFQL